MAQRPIIRPVEDAIAEIDVGTPSGPITVIGSERICREFDDLCLQQVVTTSQAPGVSKVVLNPDAHAGYGAPIGCVIASPTHIYPGPVGVDIKCSMSLLQLDLPAEEIADKRLRRALIESICQRIPTGPGKGQRSVPKSRRISSELAERVVIEGATNSVCEALGVPDAQLWIQRCEDPSHLGHDRTQAALARRWEIINRAGTIANLNEKLQQLGSYGGGNHFGEANIVSLNSDLEAQRIGSVFGLRDNAVAFLSHCGSRGLGYQLANQQFRKLQAMFAKRNLPFPGGDRELVYAELGSPEANDYLDDMALGANFASVNHLLINALVLEAFSEVVPGVTGQLVYFISHNIARQEVYNGVQAWVHRKGATRALPAAHPTLVGTPFETTGHPILLPGNPLSGSVVMAGLPGASVSCFSINHGAGRSMGRRAALRNLQQASVDQALNEADILSNCRNYPLDEAPAVYKDFAEVVSSVERAGLARAVARLSASFVIKDGDKSLGGAA